MSQLLRERPATARRPRVSAPAEVVHVLRSRGESPADLRICTPTDIDLHGAYREHWLAATMSRLFVIGTAPKPHVAFELALDDATAFRTLGGLGAGLLQARVDGTFVDVLRFSNRRAYTFERVARRLDGALHGEPLELGPEDQVDPRRCPRCGLLLDAGGEGCPRCVRRGAVLRRMWRLMRPYRWGAAGIMVLLLAGVALDLVAPQLTRHLVDHVLPAGGGTAAPTPAARRAALELLLTVVGVLAGVQVLRMGVNLLSGRLSSRIGTAITADMRQRLVAHLQQLSISYFDRQQVGTLVGRVAYDTQALHGFISQVTGGFLLQIVLLVGVGLMMFLIDVRLALFTLVPAPFVVIGSVAYWRYIYPLNYRAWEASGKQAGLLTGLLAGIRVVKAFGQEHREQARFGTASNHARDVQRGVEFANATFNPIMGLVFQLGGWIVWYVDGRDVIEARLTLGELMAFFGYLWMFYCPLGMLPQFTNWLTTFITQAHRVFEVLDTPVQVREPTAPVTLAPLRGDVSFESVSFGYQRQAPVLRQLNLELRAGELVGLVGSSGSGKTTIVNLLCRFYDVDEGCIRIDGVDVRELRKSELRRSVGVVLQEPFLFRGSIWENIAYGVPEAAPERVIAAARAACAHDFIVRQPHAYDRWVGERGAGLSGGEQQRIGIARVLLTDPRILILDEATSSVDAESEAAIQSAIAELVRGRTTLAIAHRLSTLRNADRILVLNAGQIAEAGTHAELMRARGQYARMVRLQRGGEEPADAAPPRPSPPPSVASAAALPPLGGHQPRWLAPSLARIHLGSYDTLHVTIRDERIYGGVYAVQCLPVRHPRRYISLRYVDSTGRDLEVGLVRDLAEWPAPMQALVAEALARRSFVHTVQAIHEIALVNNYLQFQVDTDLGPQSFLLRWQADRALEYGERGRMLLDTDDNRYLVPDVDALSRRERDLFHRFIYW